MNCERIRESMPELLDGRLSAARAADVRAHLADCTACWRELVEFRETLGALDELGDGAAGGRVRAGVMAAIEAEKLVQRCAGRPRRPAPPARQFRWLFAVEALAACALLALGYLAGARHTPPPSADPGTQREIAALRAKVDSMGQLVGYSLLQQQQRSANARLEGVLASAATPQPTDNAINTLIETLALDPSVNVRLNALEALYSHADRDVVRAGVLVSLPREASPLVQVAMIDFLVASRDREATSELETLSDSLNADPDVRVAAKRALTEL